MPKPIWQRTDISSNEYRLLWWIIDVDGIGHVLSRGWVNKAANTMGLHRVTITRIVNRMIKNDLLIRPAKGSLQINPEGFSSTLPENFVKFKQEE
jgi:hypothetical protein